MSQADIVFVMYYLFNLIDWVAGFWSFLGKKVSIAWLPVSKCYHMCYLCEHFSPATSIAGAISNLSALHTAHNFK